MNKEKQTERIRKKRSKEPSALFWTSMVAGEFLIDLQDFFTLVLKKLDLTKFPGNTLSMKKRQITS